MIGHSRAVQNSRRPESILQEKMNAKRILRWTWLPVGAAVLYAAAVMGMRWQASRAWEEDTRQRQADADRKIVERYGDGELKVLMFYANPALVDAGGKTLLCYGVANATSVRIDPPVQGVGPSLSRCVEVRPATSTEYKLVATGRSEQEASSSVQVDVR
jgi:hypothetical protein